MASASYGWNQPKGTFSGSSIIYSPFIGESGTITITGHTETGVWSCYLYIDSTTDGGIMYGGGATSPASGVFTYNRSSFGNCNLTYVSGTDLISAGYIRGDSSVIGFDLTNWVIDWDTAPSLPATPYVNAGNAPNSQPYIAGSDYPASFSTAPLNSSLSYTISGKTYTNTGGALTSQKPTMSGVGSVNGGFSQTLYYVGYGGSDGKWDDALCWDRHSGGGGGGWGIPRSDSGGTDVIFDTSSPNCTEPGSLTIDCRSINMYDSGVYSGVLNLSAVSTLRTLWGIKTSGTFTLPSSVVIGYNGSGDLDMRHGTVNAGTGSVNLMNCTALHGGGQTLYSMSFGGGNYSTDIFSASDSGVIKYKQTMTLSSRLDSEGPLKATYSASGIIEWTGQGATTSTPINVSGLLGQMYLSTTAYGFTIKLHPRVNATDVAISHFRGYSTIALDMYNTSSANHIQATCGWLEATDFRIGNSQITSSESKLTCNGNMFKCDKATIGAPAGSVGSATLDVSAVSSGVYIGTRDGSSATPNYATDGLYVNDTGSIKFNNGVIDQYVHCNCYVYGTLVQAPYLLHFRKMTSPNIVNFYPKSSHTWGKLEGHEINLLSNLSFVGSDGLFYLSFTTNNYNITASDDLKIFTITPGSSTITAKSFSINSNVSLGTETYLVNNGSSASHVYCSPGQTRINNLEISPTSTGQVDIGDVNMLGAYFYCTTFKARQNSVLRFFDGMTFKVDNLDLQ